MSERGREADRQFRGRERTDWFGTELSESGRARGVVFPWKRAGRSSGIQTGDGRTAGIQYSLILAADAAATSRADTSVSF